MSNVTISAKLVKELRERTGAGMMDCKKALVETNADIDAAIDLMRKSGATKAAKKQGRIAAEGLVGLAQNDTGVSIVEVNSETDFVSKSDEFIDFVNAIAQNALTENPANLEGLLNTNIGSDNIEEARKNLIAKIGENISVRRFATLTANSGETIGSYKHGERIVVLSLLKGGDEALAKDIAMHIAALKPECITEDEIDPALIEREKAIFVDQAKESGKPDNIIEKMIVGKMNKFVQEITLLGQSFVKDPDVKIAQLLKQNNAKVIKFIRFEVGEGIEKKVDNFVDEVMAQAKG
jgi:elongation factor Ts